MGKIELPVTEKIVREAAAYGYFHQNGKTVLAMGLDRGKAYFCLGRDQETDQYIIVGHEMASNYSVSNLGQFRDATISFYDETIGKMISFEQAIGFAKEHYKNPGVVEFKFEGYSLASAMELARRDRYGDLFLMQNNPPPLPIDEAIEVMEKSVKGAGFNWITGQSALATLKAYKETLSAKEQFRADDYGDLIERVKLVLEENPDEVTIDSPLDDIVETYETAFWNDLCDEGYLEDRERNNLALRDAIEQSLKEIRSETIEYKSNLDEILAKKSDKKTVVHKLVDKDIYFCSMGDLEGILDPVTYNAVKEEFLGHLKLETPGSRSSGIIMDPDFTPTLYTKAGTLGELRITQIRDIASGAPEGKTVKDALKDLQGFTPPQLSPL